MSDSDPCEVALERYTDKRRWLNLWTMLLWIFGATVVIFCSVAILLFIRETWLPGALVVLGTIVNGAGVAWVVSQRKGSEQEERDAFADFRAECGGRQQQVKPGPALQGSNPRIPTAQEINSNAWKSLLSGNSIRSRDQARRRT